MQNYRNLKVWVRAHEVTLRTYRATERFPEHERYGLRSQLRRAAASVSANLAEGAARRSDAAFLSFLDVASASASEADYHLLLARDLGYLDAEEHLEPT